jgi:hypothetical protein
MKYGNMGFLHTPPVSQSRTVICIITISNALRMSLGCSLAMTERLLISGPIHPCLEALYCARSKGYLTFTNLTKHPYRLPKCRLADQNCSLYRENGHNMVTIGCKSLCHKASRGFDPPTSTNITHYNTISCEMRGSMIRRTAVSESLYLPITLNNAKLILFALV